MIHDNPDMLLESIGDAIKYRHPLVALEQFVKLDQQLSHGSPLPGDWLADGESVGVERVEGQTQ